MNGRTRGLILTVAVLMIAATAARAETAPAGTAADEGSLRKIVEPAVCRITVENSWAIPTAYCTGFLLGGGRFVVTDLAAVAQPGTARVVVTFADGTTVTAKQFGFADPALGLVALRLESETSSRTGLTIADAPPPVDGTRAFTTVAWPWAKELALATGRVLKGPLTKDVATRLKVEPPASIESFLRIEGVRLEASSGAPVVDASGTVVAVRLDVAARDILVTLAMPAATLRKSMLSAQPELKPLSELPKPLWPVRILRMRGEPPVPADFTHPALSLRAQMACKTCGGNGKMDPGERGGFIGRLARGETGRNADFTCPVCRGDGLTLPAGAYEALAAWAMQGTSAIWAPVSDDRPRTVIRATAQEMLKLLSPAEVPMRRALAFAAATDPSRHTVPLPRGLVVFGEVGDAVDGPDGRYLFIQVQHSPTSVAMRVDDLAGPGVRAATLPPRKEPERGAWILAAGTMLARFDTGKQQGVFVLPMEWTQGTAPVAEDPGPGPGRRRDNPPDRGDGGGPGGLGGGGGGGGGGPGGGGRRGL